MRSVLCWCFIYCHICFVGICFFAIWHLGLWPLPVLTLALSRHLALSRSYCLSPFSLLSLFAQCEPFKVQEGILNVNKHFWKQAVRDSAIEHAADMTLASAAAAPRIFQLLLRLVLSTPKPSKSEILNS